LWWCHPDPCRVGVVEVITRGAQALASCTNRQLPETGFFKEAMAQLSAAVKLQGKAADRAMGWSINLRLSSANGVLNFAGLAAPLVKGREAEKMAESLMVCANVKHT
jgi:hypothetical protein